MGRASEVVVPAVIPCGDVPRLPRGHGSICPKQIFPGNDVHGGFATHVGPGARALRGAATSRTRRESDGLELAALSVIADAVSTPYQAICGAGLDEGDLAVFVGAGGVGGFGVQIAAALGARVVAIDVDAERLEMLVDHGADLTLSADERTSRSSRARSGASPRKQGIPTLASAASSRPRAPPPARPPRSVCSSTGATSRSSASPPTR